MAVLAALKSVQESRLRGFGVVYVGDDTGAQYSQTLLRPNDARQLGGVECVDRSVQHFEVSRSRSRARPRGRLVFIIIVLIIVFSLGDLAFPSASQFAHENLDPWVAMTQRNDSFRFASRDGHATLIHISRVIREVCGTGGIRERRRETERGRDQRRDQHRGQLVSGDPVEERAIGVPAVGIRHLQEPKHLSAGILEDAAQAAHEPFPKKHVQQVQFPQATVFLMTVAAARQGIREKVARVLPRRIADTVTQLTVERENLQLRQRFAQSSQKRRRISQREELQRQALDLFRYGRLVGVFFFSSRRGRVEEIRVLRGFDVARQCEGPQRGCFGREGGKFKILKEDLCCGWDCFDVFLVRMVVVVVWLLLDDGRPRFCRRCHLGYYYSPIERRNSNGLHSLSLG